MRAADQSLDRLIAKLETNEPLRFNGAPASWGGKARLVYRSRRLTRRMRRRMITFRLSQIASQHAQDAAGLNLTRAFTPRKDALAAIPEAGTNLARNINRTPGAGARQCSIRLAQGIGEQ